MNPRATLNSRALKRLRGGHPWVFRSDILAVEDAKTGSLVRLLDHRGRFQGQAFFNPESQICLRVVTREDVAVDQTFWRDKVERALLHRRQVVSGTTAYRLIYSEADGIPGLIADLYGDILVVQTLTAAADQNFSQWLSLLSEKISFQGVLAKNDVKVRALEGLPLEVRVVEGQVPDVVEVEEGPVRYRVSLHSAQKTGAFLDQRENRLAAGRYARGRILDAFCYHGGFGLHMAQEAQEVVGVEISAASAEVARANAELNGLELRIEVQNAFDYLRKLDRQGERFDTIVLDPPAFAKSRASLAQALRGYKEINLRAMKCLSPGGRLITSSCSYHLTVEGFRSLLVEAAGDSGRGFRLVEQRTQARDHPISLTFPESQYLKCFILEELGSPEIQKTLQGR